MRRERVEKHKFKRILRMDRESRYSVMNKENKKIENDLDKQLARFKSTLKKGRKDDKEEVDK